MNYLANDPDRLANAEKTFLEAINMLKDNPSTKKKSNPEEWKNHPIVPHLYTNLAFIFATRKDRKNAVENIKDVEKMFQNIYEQENLDELTSPSYALYKDLYARIMLSTAVNYENFSDMKEELNDLIGAIVAKMASPENADSTEAVCKVWYQKMKPKLRSPPPAEDIDKFLTEKVVVPLELSLKIMNKVGIKTHEFDRMSMGIGLRRASRMARA